MGITIKKRLLSFILVFVMTAGLMPAVNVTVSAVAKTGDDGVTNWDFIEPVTHQKTVPSGYIGVYTAQDLDNVRNNLSEKYILMNNIDLSSWGNWTPISTFSGQFDGNGYVIKNMTINLNGENNSVFAGLFGYVNSSIQNLGMIDSKITAVSNKSYVYVGGIAGYFSYTSGSITNCYNTGDINASTYDTSSSRAGGIVGDYNATRSITNCYNTGKVNLSVIGSSSSSQAFSCAGGITGSNSRSITNCFNTGKISAYSSYSYRSYSSSSYYSSVTNVGGITGSTGSSISGCYNVGNVSADSVSSSVSSALASLSCVGGIMGSYSSYNGAISIANCYNVGSVSASTSASAPSSVITSNAGGIGGHHYYTSGSITNCYNAGNVIAHYNNTGNGSLSPASSSNRGGISGTSNLSIANSYFLNNVSDAFGSGNATLTSVKSLADEEMRHQSSYGGFNFNTVWGIDPAINDGLPYLRSTHMGGNVFTYIITATAGAGGTVSGGGTYNEGATVTLTAVPNNNYDFDGWYENNVKISGAGSTYTFTATANRTLEARFDARRGFTISYDANGGIGNPPADHIFESGDTITLRNNTFTRDGYNFAEWNTKPDGMGTKYYPGQSIEPPATNLTLYARWVTGQVYEVVLNASIGNINGAKTITYVEGEDIILPAVDVDDCSFLGWSDDSSSLNTDVKYWAGVSTVLDTTTAASFSLLRATKPVLYIYSVYESSREFFSDGSPADGKGEFMIEIPHEPGDSGKYSLRSNAPHYQTDFFLSWTENVGKKCFIVTAKQNLTGKNRTGKIIYKYNESVIRTISVKQLGYTMKEYNNNKDDKIYYTRIPANNLKIKFVNNIVPNFKDKYRYFANGGYFATSAEPVFNLVADIDGTVPDKKFRTDPLDYKFSTLTLDTYPSGRKTFAINPRKDVPINTNYAVSGFPIIQNENYVNVNEIINHKSINHEGWGIMDWWRNGNCTVITESDKELRKDVLNATLLYNTWHGFLCLNGKIDEVDEVIYVAMKADCTTDDAYKKLDSLGLCIKYAIKIDGGGSFRFQNNGNKGKMWYNGDLKSDGKAYQKRNGKFELVDSTDGDGEGTIVSNYSGRGLNNILVWD